MAGSLPPAPLMEPPGSTAWQEWYRALSDLYSGTGAVPWVSVNKSGSNITDLSFHRHNDLTNLQGGTTNQYYHLTTEEKTALASSVQSTWTPSFTGLTVVLGGGSVTYTGRYSRLGRTIFWQVLITPAGGATTASTAGTTYHTLPVVAAQHDVSIAGNFTTLLGIGTGVLDSTNDRNYPPTWIATTDTIILSGKYEV